MAHDLECAEVLLRHHQAGRVPRLTAHEVTRLLDDTGRPSCERHFTGDFGLRQLLVHRLYGLERDGAAWHADHHLLRDHHTVSDASSGAFHSVTTHRMNHHLVSGGVDDAVRHLTATLPGHPRQWCEESLETAQAPYPGRPDERRKHAQGLLRVDGTAPRRTADQLLHAVWLSEEPTRPTRREMAPTPEQLLRQLTTTDFDSTAELGPTATKWSHPAANKQPLLRCDCTHQPSRRRQQGYPAGYPDGTDYPDRERSSTRRPARRHSQPPVSTASPPTSTRTPATPTSRKPTANAPPSTPQATTSTHRKSAP
ncbi:hypothetical protein ACIQNU_18415 [Streptomyces sp. NPDC091292]|uniref:hypothetical protein n=1 Tax=Streptomyces sp. NPDC091292 TaxID=3365991 RepID=UPI0038084041